MRVTPPVITSTNGLKGIQARGRGVNRDRDEEVIKRVTQLVLKVTSGCKAMREREHGINQEKKHERKRLQRSKVRITFTLLTFVYVSNLLSLHTPSLHWYLHILVPTHEMMNLIDDIFVF